MGTFGYMSPEQLEGRPVDVRTDVFALGVIVIEALTGSRPFNGSTIAALAASMATDSVEINLEAPEMSDTIEVLRRSVSHDPDRRFASVGEFREALMAALPRVEQSATHAKGTGVDSEAPTVYVPSSPAGLTELRGSDPSASVDYPVTEDIDSEPTSRLSSEPVEPVATADRKESEDR